MAFPISHEKAQTSATCQLCEESSDIKWKCINCDLLLCQLCCSRFHSKNDTLREHKIVNLKECGTEQAFETIRKLDLLRMKCSSHEEQICCVYCTDCDQPICSKCLIQFHQTHNLKDLDQVYKTKVAEIRDMKSKFESHLPFFENDEDDLQQMLSDGEQKMNEKKYQILQQAKSHIEELEKGWKPLETEIKKELSEVIKSKGELENQKQNLDKVLQSHLASEIFTLSYSNDKTLSTKRKSVHTINLKHKKFIQYNVAKKLMLVQTYETGLPDVHKLLLYKDKTAFISSIEGYLLKYQFDNYTLKVQKEVKIEVYDMKIMLDRVLISTWNSDLKLCSRGKIATLRSFYPLFTLGVHFSGDEILVGLSDSRSITTPTSESVRRVAFLNLDGDIKREWEFDSDNHRLFTWPRRICTFNDNIFVVDIVNDKHKGRVVVINKGGQLQWVYNGCDSVNTDDDSIFKPKDVTISKTSLIFISDMDNHAIHVLNQKGDIILCKAINHLGITFPYSLDMDKKNLLWIGSFKDSGKIHCVKINE